MYESKDINRYAVLQAVWSMINNTSRPSMPFKILSTAKGKEPKHCCMCSEPSILIHLSCNNPSGHGDHQLITV